MAFELRPLPYQYDSLAPHLSADTVETHYEKHHRSYLDKTNAAIKGGSFERKTLEEIVLESEGGLFNNAAQVWNHDCYWQSMSPTGGGQPEASVSQVLERHFGSVEAFKRELANAAETEFGSGWAWLVRTADGGLKVMKTTDAENPLRDGHKPLLTIDVWEHAYYLDYRNEREKYIEGFLDHLINWEVLEQETA